MYTTYKIWLNILIYSSKTIKNNFSLDKIFNLWEFLPDKCVSSWPETWCPCLSCSPWSSSPPSVSADCPLRTWASADCVLHVPAGGVPASVLPCRYWPGGSHRAAAGLQAWICRPDWQCQGGICWPTTGGYCPRYRPGLSVIADTETWRTPWLGQSLWWGRSGGGEMEGGGGSDDASQEEQPGWWVRGRLETTALGSPHTWAVIDQAWL